MIVDSTELNKIYAIIICETLSTYKVDINTGMVKAKRIILILKL